MQSDEPILFVELNTKNFTFVAGKFDEDQNFKILEKFTSLNEGIDNNKFTNIERIKEIVKKNISNIEENLKYVFSEIIIILDCINYSSINIAGYKKLNGSQVSKENISYILNSLKLAISKNEKNKTILHIFNSKSTLDDTVIENLPIGLFGNFYNHELAFLLIENNDLKNLKQIFSNFNINVKKIFLKDFVESTQLFNKNHHTTFFKIRIDKDYSDLYFFDKGSFIHFEKFNFGSNMIIKDIAKVCSLKKEIVNEILLDGFLQNKEFEKNDFLEKKYFVNINYRKIRKKLIFDIANARIEEICNIIFENNINIKHFLKSECEIFFNIQDHLVLTNFKEEFGKFLSKKNNFKTKYTNNFDVASTFINAANLSLYGWNKEAIPVTQIKNSLITRVFKSLFG